MKWIPMPIFLGKYPKSLTSNVLLFLLQLIHSYTSASFINSYYYCIWFFISFPYLKESLLSVTWARKVSSSHCDTLLLTGQRGSSRRGGTDVHITMNIKVVLLCSSMYIKLQLWGRWLHLLAKCFWFSQSVRHHFIDEFTSHTVECSMCLSQAACFHFVSSCE